MRPDLCWWGQILVAEARFWLLKPDLGCWGQILVAESRSADWWMDKLSHSDAGLHLQSYSASNFGAEKHQKQSQIYRNQRKKKKLSNDFIDSNHHILTFFPGSSSLPIWPNILLMIYWTKCHIWKKAGHSRPIRTAFMWYQNFAFFPYHDIST